MQDRSSGGSAGCLQVGIGRGLAIAFSGRLGGLGRRFHRRGLHPCAEVRQQHLEFRLVDAAGGLFLRGDGLALFTDIGGRVRDVTVGPDGAIYILTDEDDGKLIKVTPKG